MSGRVVLSMATSLDGLLDDSSPRRRVLSGPEDLDDVDALRASVDVIVVGAGTVRADDPRLVVRSPQRRAARQRAGLPATPARVVLTRSGTLGPAAMLRADIAPPLVLVPHDAVERVRHRLSGVAVDVGDCGSGDAGAVLAELSRRGLHRVLVEGGPGVAAQFLAADAVDELRLAVAPVLVGDPSAPRLPVPDVAPWGHDARARLVSLRALGDTAVLTYDLRARTGP